MHEMEVPLRVAIVLTVLVQTILNPMAVADNFLDGMDNNLLKVASKNLLVVDDLITLHLRILKLAISWSTMMTWL